MGDPKVLVDRDGAITTLTLNAAGKGNALDADMVEALHEAFDTAAADGTRVLALAAAGRVFCAGLDLGELQDQDDASLLLRLVRIQLLFEKLCWGPLLSVITVRGAAAGAGADLAMAATVRYAAPEATLRFPGSEFGAVLGVSRLAACTSPSLAAEVAASGRVIAAEEAARLGIWRLLEADDAADPSRLAHRLSRRSPGTVAAIQREAAGAAGAPQDPLGALVRSLASSPGLAGRIAELNERRLLAGGPRK